jgi:hypothetical protein
MMFSDPTAEPPTLSPAAGGEGGTLRLRFAPAGDILADILATPSPACGRVGVGDPPAQNAVPSFIA